MIRHIYTEKHNEVVRYKIAAIGMATKADCYGGIVLETEIMWAALPGIMCVSKTVKKGEVLNKTKAVFPEFSQKLTP